RSRGRRKTNWRTVNLADYDPICAGEFDLEEYTPPQRIRLISKPGCKPSSPPPLEDTVTTRSEWKYMGKQVRKMLIPGSISAFASCMWVSLELVHGTPIAAFSKIVELVLPFWDTMHADEQDAWTERALAEGRRAHWIYVRNGRSGGSGSMGAASHVQCPVSSDSRPSSRSRKKAQEWDDDYDDEELSDTDELPSRPTRKLNIDCDDAEPMVTSSSSGPPPVPKEFASEDPHSSSPPSHPFGTKRTVTFSMDHHHDEPEPPREPWRERDGTRTVPPPPLTYRPIIVSANPRPAYNTPPPSSFYPVQSAMRGRGAYIGRRPSRGGFDMYPAAVMPSSGAHLAPWARGVTPRGGHIPLAAPIGFR
ncbi:hypothetical protein PENTCL1PPCAC_18568, partial [Pristionchus entomophagus]